MSGNEAFGVFQQLVPEVMLHTEEPLEHQPVLVQIALQNFESFHGLQETVRPRLLTDT